MSDTPDDSDGTGRGYDAALLRRLLALPPAVPLAGRWRRCCCCCRSPGWRWSARGSPSARSTWPCPKHDLGLLGLLTRRSISATLLLEFVVEYGGTLLTTYIGQRVMYDLRMQIFAHLQRLSITLLRPQSRSAG